MKKWIPPPFVRNPKMTRDYYRTQGRCEECGAGVYEVATSVTIRPHHPSCPILKKAVTAKLSVTEAVVSASILCGVVSRDHRRNSK